MRKLLLTFIAVAAMVMAQSQPPNASGSPNNAWPNDPQGYYFAPDAQISTQVCAWVIVNGNVYVPVPNTPVTLSTYTTQFSGWHSHEVSPSGRPQAIILGSPSAYTGSNGCYTWQVEFPGIAGWYTFQAHFSPVPFDGLIVYQADKGINNYVKYSDTVGPGHGDLVPYPDNPTINMPQSLYVDVGHDSASRFLQPFVEQAVVGASTAYVSDSAIELGVTDRIDVYRASLPDGGLADNESYSYGAANWEARAWEEHARGSELDVVNPSYGTYNSAKTNFVDVALVDLQKQANCIVGSREPGTDSKMSDPFGYWVGQYYIHIVCAPAPLIRYSPGRGF